MCMLHCSEAVLVNEKQKNFDNFKMHSTNVKIQTIVD